MSYAQAEVCGFLKAMIFHWITTNVLNPARELEIARFIHCKFQGGQTCRARREIMRLVSSSIHQMEGVLPRS
jgi:hypothetical protein